MSAFGTLLKLGDGEEPEAFTAIAEVTELSGPGMSLEPLELTHHESTGAWKEFTGGLLDGGEISLSVNFLPTNSTHTGLRDVMVSRVARNFQLVFPDSAATTWQFAALVTGYEPKEPVGGKLSADIKLKLTGQPNFSAGGE